MEQFSSFNAYIQRAITENWDQDALTDYQGITLQFHDVARKIEKLHILLENSGIKTPHTFREQRNQEGRQDCHLRP